MSQFDLTPVAVIARFLYAWRQAGADAVTDAEFREHLATTHASLTRLLEEARAGRFTVGDDMDTGHATNIKAQVEKIQKALDDINHALGTLSEITDANRT